jgi:hypothetical protein
MARLDTGADLEEIDASSLLITRREESICKLDFNLKK